MLKINKEAGKMDPTQEYQNLRKRMKTKEGDEDEKKEESQKPKVFINPLKLKNPLAKDFRIDPKAYIQLKRLEVKNKHTSHTEGKTSSSFTSTSLTPTTQNEFRVKSDEELRKEFYQLIKSRQLKGEVELATTLGKLTLTIHCDYCPKTGENFIEL